MLAALPVTERDVLIYAGCLALIALTAMVLLHERHYRERRGPIDEARYEGLERRVATVENILREDRFT
jgi:hypothetical protein